MIVYLLIAAFGLSSILHYSVQKIFIYYKKFDDFNHRSSHKTLATRTGGIAVRSSQPCRGRHSARPCHLRGTDESSADGSTTRRRVVAYLSAWQAVTMATC